MTEQELQDTKEFQTKLDEFEMQSTDPAIRAAALRRSVTASVREELQSETERQNLSAESAKTRYLFFKEHPTLACEANEQLLDEFCASHGILISGSAYDFAYHSLKKTGQLAERQPERHVEPEPQLTAQEKIAANNARLLSMSKKDLWKEVKTGRAVPVPVITLPYTAQQLKQMPARNLRAIISYPNGGQDRPGYREAVNKILSEAAAAEAAGK